MFKRAKMDAQMSQELIDAITDRGQRDLNELRIDDLETEVYEFVDRLSQRTIRGVLEDQALSTAERMKQCPQCGANLVDQPPQQKALATQRTEVEWEQPVKRCTACRCDFFPSG